MKCVMFWQAQVALKCADIGNPCRPWKLSRRWGEMICQEFYLQGMSLLYHAHDLIPLLNNLLFSVVFNY